MPFRRGLGKMLSFTLESLKLFHPRGIALSRRAEERNTVDAPVGSRIVHV